MASEVTRQEWDQAKAWIAAVKLRYKRNESATGHADLFKAGWLSALEALLDSGDRSSQLFTFILSLE